MQLNSNSKEIKRRLRELIPDASMEDFIAVEKIANAGHLRHLPPSIRAWQALTTHIRHNHTDYDAMLNEGYDCDWAKHFILDTINQKLMSWGCHKRITENEQ